MCQEDLPGTSANDRPSAGRSKNRAGLTQLGQFAMGKGGEAQLGATIRPGLIQRIRSMDRMETLKGVKQDLTVLKSMWFKKASGSDHAERLESFYGPQAAACELIYAAVSCMLGRIGWLAGSGLSGRLAVCDHIGSHKLIQSLSGALIPRPHV